MSERNQSRLQFSIEESVWLNKGQEVDELYSIALDPNVTIEEMDDQVCIKGHLCLSGEYRCKGENDTEGQDQEYSVNPLSYRSFSQLKESKEECANLEHKFPVDITLPKNRVRNSNDLYVSVDHFDYDIPTPSCIEVSASVCISGVYENPMEEQDEPYEASNQEEGREPENEEHYEFSEEASNPFPILEFESRRAPQRFDQDEVESVHQQTPRHEPQVGFSSRVEEDEEQSQPFNLSYMRNDAYQAETYEAEEATYEAMEYEEEEYAYEEEEYEYEYESDEEEYEEMEEEVASSPQRPQREENALYLTKMLTRDDEELTKMKMCIIQAGDSLDTIAGRYDVPTSQLMRVNRLESEDIEEGQILYIPVSAHR
ncbi:stage VI sporulation protein D [Pseudalkalibacillus sp. SCS-8]|uniref:stage VI sporulation protein D n=1 Tax=Pseudalkalibacillus nanhaiensis TaxID=3115291 RepID=UPI0032DAB93F